MKIVKGVNPQNLRQARAFFCSLTAESVGETRHPQIAMKEISGRYNFKVLAAVPQSLFDGWDFWIEFIAEPTDIGPTFQDFPWKPVGQA